MTGSDSWLFQTLEKSNPFLEMLYQGKKWIYKKADALIFTQESGFDYIREHKWNLEQGGLNRSDQQNNMWRL